MHEQGERVDEQGRRYRKALARKDAAAREEAESTRAREQEQRIDARHAAGEIDPRTKSSAHGQVTADKWNQ